MVFRKHQLLLLSSLLIFSSLSFAATKKKMGNGDNSKVPSQNLAAPSWDELQALTSQDLERIPNNFMNESKRRPANSSQVGTEDMLSKEYVAFRNELLKARTGQQFNDVIKKYSDNFDKIPLSARDLKFTIARMAAWLPMRGVIWRMAPMVHKITTTQAGLVASLKNFSEQVKINMPDSHLEAQMLFLTMPTPELVGKEFHTESDFVTFLMTDVYEALKTSGKRLIILKMYNEGPNGTQLPMLFDGKIRFGDDAFGDNYDSFERFKVVGEAERTAALARIHRRMYAISVMGAYNWNGHLAVKKEIGALFGMGIAESALFDALPGEDDPYLRSVSREARVKVIKKYPELYKRTPNGQSWMNLAYYHLYTSGQYLGKTWENIKNNTSGYVAQLDPEVFMARKEQVEAGVMNTKKLVGAYGKGVDGTTRINGSLSGEEIEVNVKGFFDNSPADLKDLLPTGFAKNEDLNELKSNAEFKTLTPVRADKDIMQITFDKSTAPVRFRNYLYGRATKWNIGKNAYGTLFPNLQKPEDVAKAMRILNETRGARLLTSGLTMFIR